MRRLLAIILGLLALWLWTPPSFAATPPGQPELLNAYTYDTPGADSSADTASERAPSSQDDLSTVYDADGHWSRGTSARAERAVSGSTSTYTTSAGFARDTSVTTRTGGRAVPIDVDFSSLLPWRVAAESGTLYRTGSRTDGALTDPTGVSFRDSISSSSDGAQVFKRGDKIWAVDSGLLPRGSVLRDGTPAGHVSVRATPDEIRAAVFDDPFLRDSGMKRLDDGSYRLPK
jgi:hypothetical protein